MRQTNIYEFAPVSNIKVANRVVLIRNVRYIVEYSKEGIKLIKEG